MHRYIVLTILILCVIPAPTGLCANSTQQPCQPPALAAGPREPNIFSDAQQMDLGDAIAEHLQRNFRIIEDDEVTAGLDRIGQRIVQHLPPTNLKFHFFLLDLPQVNAFTLPGGRIYVSRKLIAFVQSEDELAAVLSHELGHAFARQGAIDMTRLMKEVLGVTQVGDRQDILAKYKPTGRQQRPKTQSFPDQQRGKGPRLGCLKVGQTVSLLCSKAGRIGLIRSNQTREPPGQIIKVPGACHPALGNHANLSQSPA
jgi:hypothetical protein